MFFVVTLGSFVLFAFVVFSLFLKYQPRDWIVKWPILCQVGCRTLARSIRLTNLDSVYSETSLMFTWQIEWPFTENNVIHGKQTVVT